MNSSVQFTHISLFCVQTLHTLLFVVENIVYLQNYLRYTISSFVVVCDDPFGLVSLFYSVTASTVNFPWNVKFVVCVSIVHSCI